jgi:hypothetical protein
MENGARRLPHTLHHTAKETTMDTKDKEHGEGNYKATKDYNERTKDFIDSGKVDEAAANSRPKSDQEAREMREAEEAGKSHSKGER